MDDRFAKLDEIAPAVKVLGYLNFSDGRPDPRWEKLFGDAHGFLADQGEERPWMALHDWLTARLQGLKAGSVAGFKEVGQAEAALDLVFNQILPAYRMHHADLLFHQSESDLLQPYFLARVCEAVLAQGPGRNVLTKKGRAEPDREFVENVLGRLNDFVGHRPVAILESRPRGEPYDHERVRPIPLYLRGAGVAPGRYREIVSQALDILEKTDLAILQEASFDLELLDELALDPRAYDHSHPVNRRPNYVFGEWDPHHLDNQGRYRRYVVRQIILDGLLDRVNSAGDMDRKEMLFEASAVLAGTMLMAAGVSGNGPEAHDSTTTLATLLPRIAPYRDAFYSDLLKKVDGFHGQRLRQESASSKQAFGMARQKVNHFLARHRAFQLQERHLAVLFAEMGYPDAGQEEAARIPTASMRILSAIQGRLTTGRLLGERGQPGQAVALLDEIRDLLQRGIACGALVDPWNLLGFQGLFPLFAAREDAVRDHRIDELLAIVEQTFDLYARLMSEAAARGEKDLVTTLSTNLRGLGEWWDRFGSVNVSDVRRVHGGEAAESAEQVADALGRWHERGEAAADLAFWRQHLEDFHSAKAYSLVVDALLRKGDFRASMALLVNWLSQAVQVPLEEGEDDHTFAALALRWMLGLTAAGRDNSFSPGLDNPGKEIKRGQRSEVWPLIKKFFDYLEANAEDYWEAPSLETGQVEQLEIEPTPVEDLFEAAYEGVTFRDTAEDGTEGPLVDDGPRSEPFDLEEENERLERRLRFLSTLARLWQIAARYDLTSHADAGKGAALSSWLATAGEQQQNLLHLLDAINAYSVPEPAAVHEDLVEYDRRRGIKEQLLHMAIGTCLDNTLAFGALQGALEVLNKDKHDARKPSGPVQEAGWGPLAIQLESALLRGDATAVRELLPAFLELFRHEPLLFRALSEGGEPRLVLRVRVAQTILRALAGNLPRLGLIRETFHLLRGALATEREHPPEGRGITEFNHLFQASFQSVVECVVESAEGWGLGDETDRELVGILEALTSHFLTLWIDHSRTLQLATLEAVRGDPHWKTLCDFVKQYGGDFFHARFMTLANLRGILHRGIGPYLDYLGENPDPLHPIKLLDDLGRHVRREDAIACLQLILQAVVENYEEYKDYNTTTSLSDYGQNLHVLLDFLRLKVGYERHAWQFRPLVLVHEVMARAGRDTTAVRWEAAFTQISGALADQHLAQLTQLEKKHGVSLSTVADRIRERFVKPLQLDRLCALIGPAMKEARDPTNQPTFTKIRADLEPFAATPTGVGLDVPQWLRRLEMETQRVRATHSAVALLAEELFRVPRRMVTLQEIQQQLTAWDNPRIR